jgi:molecular chaperone DnaJ
MNLQEARTILEISPDTTAEEAKKKYRDLTKKYHPDVNKEPGAEDKFKKINEAYSCIQNGKGNDKEDFDMAGHNPFEWGFNINQPFGRQRSQKVNLQHVQTNTTISFKESVLGTKKEISFTRKIKCDECNGNGEQQISNGCDKCHGLGTFTQQRGNMIFTQTCNKCGGRIKSQPCQKCNTTGSIVMDVSVQVNIPGGVIDGNILRLGGMGNFAGNFMGIDQYTDAHLTISVTPQPNLKLIKQDVVSTLKISLLEGLSGCTKSVETISGFKDININPKSRNNDEVIIPGLGVEGVGNHRIILDVEYPENVTDLIDFLNK